MLFLIELTASERRSRVSANHELDLLVTHCSPVRLSVLFFYFLPSIKPRCYGNVKGFFGGSGNIAIMTALPASFCDVLLTFDIGL